MKKIKIVVAVVGSVVPWLFCLLQVGYSDLAYLKIFHTYTDPMRI